MCNKIKYKRICFTTLKKKMTQHEIYTDIFNIETNNFPEAEFTGDIRPFEFNEENRTKIISLFDIYKSIQSQDLELID